MEIFYYTSRGLCPYLAGQSLEAVSISFVHFYKNKAIFDKISLGDYTHNKGKTLLVIKDLKNANSVKGGQKFDKLTVSIPENSEISLKNYISFIEKAKVDFFVSFSEESDFKSGFKRAERTAQNAVKALNQCLSLHKAGIYANIQGGKDIAVRRWCILNMKDTEAFGLYFGGLGLDDHGLVLRSLLKESFRGVSDISKPLMLSGVGRPLDIIFASSLGFSQFETSYPFYLAERGKALNFRFDELADVEELVEDDHFEEEVIDLNEEQFRFQNEAIVDKCACVTCRVHSRGYLYHLLQMKEMTAKSLLAEHNVWVYKEMAKFLEKMKGKGIEKAFGTFVKGCCVKVVKDE